MDDMISRAAAIDAFLTELTKRERKNFLHTWSTVEVKYFVADMLEKLPAAQPVAKDICVPVKDCISRQQAIATAVSAAIDWHRLANPQYSIAYSIGEAMRALPSAQQERKKGKWIYNSPVTMKCNQCGFVIKDWDWHRFKYCPNCIADMRGENDG